VVIADGFEVLVDPKPRFPAKPAIALRVDSIDGESFLIPIEFSAARDLVMMMFGTLQRYAPQLFKSRGKKLI
jgi:hypothetical protein